MIRNRFPAYPLGRQGASGVVLVVAAVGAFMLWKLSALVLAVFGAAVIAVVLSGSAFWVERRVGLRYSLALAAIILVVALVVVGSLWLFGSQTFSQLAALEQLLPQAYGELQQWLSTNQTGQALNSALASVSPDPDLLRTRLGALLSSATSAIGVVGLMLVGGIYFAVDPGLYVRGSIRLVPLAHRPLAQDTLDRCAHALRSWLGGQLTSMAAVGLMTALGLWLLDVPAVLGLALLTAGLGIIPIVGPILAALPAALLGFTVSPQTALGVLGLYVLVQQIEGNLLQPIIQKYAVELPPALLLFSLFAVGALFGALGVLLAAPFTVVVFVAIKRIYVGHILGDDAFAGAVR